MKDHFYLFVYGPLRNGAAPQVVLAGAERVAGGTVAGALYATDHLCPALVLAGRGEIPGEIWLCPVTLLPRLDEHQDVERGSFRRVAVRAAGHACWTYVAGPGLARGLTPEKRLAVRAYAPRD